MIQKQKKTEYNQTVFAFLQFFSLHDTRPPLCERKAASGTVPSECEAEGLYQNGFLSGERPLTSTFGGGAEGTEAEGVFQRG